jgi:hypothetical protein
MNERVRNFDAVEDDLYTGRQEEAQRASTMRERLEVWVNEGGAGGDDESQTVALTRKSPQRLHSLAHE